MDRSGDIIEHRDLSILPLLLEPRGTLAKFKKEENPKNSQDLEFHSPRLKFCLDYFLAV